MNAATNISSLISEAELCRGRRVVICEDHPPTRLGFHFICLQLNCEVVAETASGTQAVALVEKYKPDLLILDLQLLPGIDGQEVHRQLRERGLAVKVLVITSFCDSARFFDWINQPDGPDSVLAKSTSLQEMRLAICQILTTNNKYIPASIWNREHGDASNPLSRLAAHELRVLRDVAQGLTLKEIAVRQQLSAQTVRGYMGSIYTKLGLESRTLQAATSAYDKWIAVGYSALAEYESSSPALSFEAL